MSMSKKDFIALADAIRPALKAAGLATVEKPADQYLKGNLEGIEHMVDVLAYFCAKQNPRFMRDRWLGYIAVENGKNGGTVKQRKLRSCQYCGVSLSDVAGPSCGRPSLHKVD